jgi:hypothetical protein
MPGYDFANLMLNSPSWYHIETAPEYIRAAIWCAANLATAISCFLIPNELGRWRKTLPFTESALIGRLFTGVVFLCGLSNLAILVIVPVGPWWATLLIYLPMAFLSVATLVVLRRDRAMIVGVLENVVQGLKGTQ